MWDWIVETERLLYTAPLQARAGYGALVSSFVAAMCCSWLSFRDRIPLLQTLGAVLGGAFVAAIAGAFLGLLAFIVLPGLVAVTAGFGFGWSAVQISRISKVRKKRRNSKVVKFKAR